MRLMTGRGRTNGINHWKSEAPLKGKPQDTESGLACCLILSANCVGIALHQPKIFLKFWYEMFDRKRIKDRLGVWQQKHSQMLVSAFDRDDLASDERRSVTKQEHRGVCDILDRARPS